MGRQVNEARVTTRNARKSLGVQKAPHWRAIDRGAHIGYRKGANGGTWIARYRLASRKYVTQAIGAADDALEADGERVLTFYQAVAKARSWCEAHACPNEPSDLTIGDALDAYLSWYEHHRKSFYEVKRRIEADIRPKLGDIAINDLEAATIREWHEGLAKTAPRFRAPKVGKRKTREMPTDPEGIRKRRSSTNKLLTILKAALNKAFENDNGKIKSDDAWRRVKPFRDVDAARMRYLDVDEAQRLVNASDPDFRKLIKAALYTGARYGELISTEVADFGHDAGTLHIRFSKSGKPRHIPLTDEGRAFFDQITAGRAGSARLFVRDDDQPWGKSHQIRRMSDACERAKIDPSISFHILRHSYGSWLAMKGVSIKVIADALGHADTRVTERHYAALAPNYVADTVRAHLPSLGGPESKEIVTLRRSSETSS